MLICNYVNNMNNAGVWDSSQCARIGKALCEGLTMALYLCLLYLGTFIMCTIALPVFFIRHSVVLLSPYKPIRQNVVLLSPASTYKT